MKSTLNVINTALAANAVNTVASVVNDLRVSDDKEQWHRLVEYGEYPVTAVINGKPTEVMQVLDREAGELMAGNHTTVINQIKHLWRGLPIYVGHPDDAAWMERNPGADSSSKGRIKGIEAREDGIYMLTAFNDEGRSLLSGESPKFSAQSPNWDMVPIEEGGKRYRPYVLRSIGLTNQPNIPSCAIGLNTAGANQPSPSATASAVEESEKTEINTHEMDPELLKRLGLKPEATQAEINAAIAKLLDDKATADAVKATAESNVAAANTRATKAETDLATLRASVVTSAINTAITDGRITEAEKPTWEGLLTADFKNGSAALDAKGKATAINTAKKIPDLSKRQGEGAKTLTGVNAVNQAVRAYASEHGLDLKKTADYDEAFAAVEAAKPELFTD